jgi:hypothetical protein
MAFMIAKILGVLLLAVIMLALAMGVQEEVRYSDSSSISRDETVIKGDGAFAQDIMAKGYDAPVFIRTDSLRGSLDHFIMNCRANCHDRLLFLAESLDSEPHIID